MHTGLAVISGTEDRQHAYVALTRYDRVTTERAGQPGKAGTVTGMGNPLSVLYDMLERDGQQLSASQTRQQALQIAALMDEREERTGEHARACSRAGSGRWPCGWR